MTTELKHTPGPWGTENAMSSDYENIRYLTGPNCEQIATIHQRKPLCNVEKLPRMNQAEALANARLISAAPELLTHLRLFCDTLPDDPNDYPDMQLFRIVRDLVEKSNAVIAKATGKERGE